MTRPIDPCIEVLDRISPVLPALFNAYRVPESRAREIVEDACRTLDGKAAAAARGRGRVAAADHHRELPALAEGDKA